MSEYGERWIKDNIKQRRCVVFCKLNDEHPNLCKCNRHIDDHPNPEDNQSQGWTRSRNTRIEDCEHFGQINFTENRSSKEDIHDARYVRLDVETEMSTVETLLFDIWKLRKPKWILSVMGNAEQKHLSEEVYPEEIEEKFQTDLRSAVRSLSNGQSIMVTSEGTNKGLARIVEETFQDETDTLENVTVLGFFSWGAFDEKILRKNKTNECLSRRTEGNGPSRLHSHLFLIDDGTEGPSSCKSSFQQFRMKMETFLAKHSDKTQSIPLVKLLYGGSLSVIDDVRTAIGNNIPIVVLEGTGGVADIVAFLQADSTLDKWNKDITINSKSLEVEFRFSVMFGQPFKSHQHNISLCLRGIHAVVNFYRWRNMEYHLVKAIITATLQSKTLAEIIRVMEYHMPARRIAEEGIATDNKDVTTTKEQLAIENRQLTTGLFLAEAIQLDLSACAEYIINNSGIDLLSCISDGTLIRYMDPPSHHFAQVLSPETEDQVFQSLYIWAVENYNHNCAAVFWKKGKHLLGASLVTTLALGTMMERTHLNDRRKKNILKEQVILSENRTIGLLNTCFETDTFNTMVLLKKQSMENMWTKRNFCEDCLAEGNRKIFNTKAFRSYMTKVWLGKISPNYGNTYTEPGNKHTDTLLKYLAVIGTSPVVTFSLNLVFYAVFLGIFGYTLLFNLGPQFSALEGILVVWWFAFVWEEIRQVSLISVAKSVFNSLGHMSRSYPHEKSNQRIFEANVADMNGSVQICRQRRFAIIRAKLRRYIDDNWNILDITCLLLFLIGGILMTVFHLDNTRTDVYEAARIFLSLDIMLFTWRILQYLAVFGNMGTLLQMIYEMILNLIPFLVILFVFIIAQGLAVHALLYPNRQWKAESLLDIPKSAFWNIFGELGQEEIEAFEAHDDCSTNATLFEEDLAKECPSTVGRYAVPFLLAVHMLLTNLLLFNLIIAKFSSTFQDIHQESEWIAAWHRAKIILEYYGKPPLPPPFNVCFDVCYFIYKKTVKQNEEPNETEDAEEDYYYYYEYLDKWEREMAESYLASIESKSDSEVVSNNRDDKVIAEIETLKKMLQDVTQRISNEPPRTRTVGIQTRQSGQTASVHVTEAN